MNLNETYQQVRDRAKKAGYAIDQVILTITWNAIVEEVAFVCHEHEAEPEGCREGEGRKPRLVSSEAKPEKRWDQPGTSVLWLAGAYSFGS